MDTALKQVKKWTINTRRLDLMKKNAKYLNGNIRICSDHFEPEMFANSSRTTLTSNATPTLLNISNPPPQVDQKRRLLHREEVITTYSYSKYKCMSRYHKILNISSLLCLLVDFANALKNVNLNNQCVVLPLPLITLSQTTL